MSRVRSALITTSMAAISTTVLIGTLALPAAATSTSTSAATVSANPSNLTYTVKPGDYLTGIANKLGVRLGDLLTANHIKLDTVIYPGRTLVVPAGGVLPAETNATVQPAASAARYLVAQGDYLTGIARKLGVTLSALVAANGLTTTSAIHPGDTLSLPAGGTLPAPPAPKAAAVAPAAANTTYVVQPGDFLINIAAKNGVTLKALLAANSMVVTSAIFPGMQLGVPPATLPIPAAPAAATPAEPTADSPINTVVEFLRAQAGKAYRFNTAGPDTYDCSGLVRAAFLTIGISLPHQSLLQSQKGTAVDWRTEELRPGDLVFQYSAANPTVISHVGIAITSSTWIQAARSGVPIKIGPLPHDDRIQSVRRIVEG